MFIRGENGNIINLVHVLYIKIKVSEKLDNSGEYRMSAYPAVDRLATSVTESIILADKCTQKEIDFLLFSIEYAIHCGEEIINLADILTDFRKI